MPLLTKSKYIVGLQCPKYLWMMFHDLDKIPPFDAATLACYHKVLRGGDGIVGTDVEETIKNIGELAQTGMQTTDEVILGIMTK